MKILDDLIKEKRYKESNLKVVTVNGDKLAIKRTFGVHNYYVDLTNAWNFWGETETSFKNCITKDPNVIVDAFNKLCPLIETYEIKPYEPKQDGWNQRNYGVESYLFWRDNPNGRFERPEVTKQIADSIEVAEKLTLSHQAKKEMLSYTTKGIPPFRVGRKQKRVILDSTGHEILKFPEGLEALAEFYCMEMNKLKK